MKIKTNLRNFVSDLILLGFDSRIAGESKIFCKEDVACQFKTTDDANTSKISILN